MILIRVIRVFRGQYFYKIILPTYLFLIVFMILSAMNLTAQMPPVEAGVSQALAKWRGKHYSDVRYKLNITLEKGAPLMKGEIEIRVKLSEPPAVAGGFNPTIILDWRKIRGKENLSTVSNVSVNGKVLSLNPPATAGGSDKFDEINEHLVFQDGVKTGENVIKLNFTSPIATSGAAVTRYVDKEDSAEYVYSLFVPSDASTAFPVFDQPDLKAKFQLDLIIPKEWNAVSNSNPFSFTQFSGLRTNVKIVNSEDIKQRKIGFIETKPISTYVFAFAGGDFSQRRKPARQQGRRQR